MNNLTGRNVKTLTTEQIADMLDEIYFQDGFCLMSSLGIKTTDFPVQIFNNNKRMDAFYLGVKAVLHYLIDEPFTSVIVSPAEE